MASYKVPQDVEADDKLIGPFSFRQFIYLIVVAMSVALAWGLAQLFIGLAILPLPIILLFGALALPLRKDQPMEIYLAAMVSFFLKPRKRIWDPEGMESTIQITAPKTVEVKRTKDLSEDEAHERLNYLARLVDTQGWSTRGVQANQNLSMNNDVVLEAQSAEDVLDTNTSIANNFGQMMQESTQRMHDEARQRMMAATTIPEPQQLAPVQRPSVSDAQGAVSAAYTAPVQEAPAIQQPVFNPYPTIQQSVVQPLAQEDKIPRPLEVPVTQSTFINNQEPPTPESTSVTEPTADIIELANNADLSIQTIAHEANRLKKLSEDPDEVVISLR